MKEYKVKGWVSRCLAGYLTFHADKPFHDDSVSGWRSDEELDLDEDWFPELEYPNEPIEVEMSIKKI